MHLFDIDIPGKITFKESEVLSAGDQLTTFDCEGVTVGIGICYDLRFNEMAHLMAQKGEIPTVLLPNLPTTFCIVNGIWN